MWRRQCPIFCKRLQTLIDDLESILHDARQNIPLREDAPSVPPPPASDEQAPRRAAASQLMAMKSQKQASVLAPRGQLAAAM